MFKAIIPTSDRQTPTDRMNRREFVATSLAAAASSLLPTQVYAQAKSFAGVKLVYASWGGLHQAGHKKSWCDPFAQKTGAEVAQDTLLSYAKLRTDLEAGQAVWDVVDMNSGFFYSTKGNNYYLPIDKAIVDVGRIEPKLVDEVGIGCEIWAYTLGYNGTVISGEGPKNWTDFFDLKKFPGRRSIQNRPDITLEIALLADGVPIENLYPLDLNRAFKKLDTIKAQSIFYTSHSHAQQLLTDGEAVMGCINNGRVYDAVKKGAPLKIVWAQNLQYSDFLVVPRNTKNREAAMALINEMTLPENQAAFANSTGFAPSNPSAYSLLKDDVKPWLPAGDNLKRGRLVDGSFWRDNLEAITEKWTAWKLS